MSQDQIPTPDELHRALRELGVDVPVYRARVVGSRIELHLYGGAIRLWPEGDVDVVARFSAPEERPDQTSEEPSEVSIPKVAKAKKVAGNP